MRSGSEKGRERKDREAATQFYVGALHVKMTIERLSAVLANTRLECYSCPCLYTGMPLVVLAVVLVVRFVAKSCGLRVVPDMYISSTPRPVSESQPTLHDPLKAYTFQTEITQPLWMITSLGKLMYSKRLAPECTYRL